MNLPNFFVIGAAKAGSTTIYDGLSQHPDVFMSPIKETNFFSYVDMSEKYFSSRYQASINFNLTKYLAQQNRRAVHIANVTNLDEYKLLFRDAAHETAIGEASNSYLFCPSTASQIHKKIKSPKFIIILRNPVDRAWSHYLMNLKLGHVTHSDFITEYENDSRTNPQGWGITSNYDKLGRYVNQIKRYFSLFPRESFHISLFDQLQNNQSELFESIFEFLEVDSKALASRQILSNRAAKPRFRTLNKLLTQSSPAISLYRLMPDKLRNITNQLFFTTNSVPVLSIRDRKLLIDKYYDEIIDLEALLDLDLTHWRMTSK